MEAWGMVSQITLVGLVSLVQLKHMDAVAVVEVFDHDPPAKVWKLWRSIFKRPLHPGSGLSTAHGFEFLALRFGFFGQSVGHN